jgi:hypothetical protein
VPGDRHNHPVRWSWPTMLQIEPLSHLRYVQLLRSAGQPLHLQQRNARLHMHSLRGQGPVLLHRQYEQRGCMQITLHVRVELYRGGLRLHMHERHQHVDRDWNGDVLELSPDCDF